MGPSLQRRGPWKSIATHPSTEPQTFAFVKIDLGSCNPLVLDNNLFHSLYIQPAGYKHCDVISERGNPCRKAASKRDTAQGRTSPLIPKPAQEGLQREEIEKRRQRAALPDRTLDRDHPERLPFTCTTARGLWYIMLIHLRNSGSNPPVSKTDAKNRWSTLSKALDWSKLISAASVSSFIPSRTLRIKCRLSWIDLPFTGKVYSGPIRSLMTSCKRFAKTRAKIFNSVLSRVMGL